MNFAKSLIQGILEALKFIFIDAIGGLLNETGKSPLFAGIPDILKGLAISGSVFGIIVLLLNKIDQIWEIINKIKAKKNK